MTSWSGSHIQWVHDPFHCLMNFIHINQMQFIAMNKYFSIIIIFLFVLSLEQSNYGECFKNESCSYLHVLNRNGRHNPYIKIPQLYNHSLPEISLLHFSCFYIFSRNMNITSIQSFSFFTRFRQINSIYPFTINQTSKYDYPNHFSKL